VNDLEGEKQKLKAQLEYIQHKCSEKQVELQKQIDDYESQIRKTTESNTVLKNQIDSLNSELTNKGELPAQHAEQLQKQTEEFQKQFENQENVNKQKIDELTDKIKQCDDKIGDLEKKALEKEAEVSSKVEVINDKQNQELSKIEELNKEISDLKNENNDLIQKIIAATKEINQVSENLERLAESVPPNSQTEKDINQLLSEIEKYIQNISDIIKGNSSQNIEENLSLSDFKISSNTMITVSQIGGPPIQVEFKYIIEELLRRSNLSGNVGTYDKSNKTYLFDKASKKYMDTLNQIKKAQTPEEVSDILNENNVSFKNGKLIGGKKTRKHRKHKYNKNTKKRSIMKYFFNRRKKTKFTNKVKRNRK